MLKFILIMLSIVFAQACTCSSAKVEPDTAEEMRKIARENSLLVAQQYRADGRYENFDIMPRGDSTIDTKCPQGDGWASLELIERATKEKIKIKCSTVSVGIGCMTDEDFRARSQYATQEGKCSTEIQFPLKKIGQ